MHRARPRRTSGLPSHPRRPLLHYETDRVYIVGLARVRGGVSPELTACTWSRTCSGAWPWPGRVASFRVSLRELGGRRCRLDRVRCAIGGRHPSPSPTGPDFSARTLRLVGAGLLEPLVDRTQTQRAACYYSGCLQHGNRGTGRHMVEVIRRACTGAVRAEDEQAHLGKSSDPCATRTAQRHTATRPISD